MSGDAWFSALGEPLDDAERTEIASYLSALGMEAPVRTVASWKEAAGGAQRAAAHPFLRKDALYCGGRWPLGVYEGRFAIF